MPPRDGARVSEGSGASTESRSAAVDASESRGERRVRGRLVGCAEVVALVRSGEDELARREADGLLSLKARSYGQPSWSCVPH